MTTPDPNAFAAAWLAAWNAHDVEAVLAHFHDDAVFTSPYAAIILPDSDGRLVGKAALRDYWTAGLARLLDLRFVLETVYAGVDTIVIAYRNQRGERVAEVLRFADGRVSVGHAAYAAP